MYLPPMVYPPTAFYRPVGYGIGVPPADPVSPTAPARTGDTEISGGDGPGRVAGPGLGGSDRVGDRGQGALVAR